MSTDDAPANTTALHWIMTLTWPSESATKVSTAAGVTVIPDEVSRSAVFIDLWQGMAADKGIDYRDSSVLFFSLEPNSMGASHEP